MRSSSSSSCTIKLVLRCNVLHCSVHVLKPAVFIAPLRLRLNHTPNALLLAKGCGKGVVLVSLRVARKSRDNGESGWGYGEVRIRGLQKYPLTNGRKRNIA
jgi:hypothetical protein